MIVFIAKLRAKIAYAWDHRTKVIGTIGIGLGYLYVNQDKLALVIPAKFMGCAVMVVGGGTLAIGFYNTLKRRDADPT